MPTCPTCRRQLALTVAVDSLLVGTVANRKLASTQLLSGVQPPALAAAPPK